MIAGFLHKRLKKYYADNRDSIKYSSNRGYILILDRSFDLYSPVMHDFTLGSLVYDFLQKSPLSKEVKYKAGAGDGVYRLENERDTLWNKYKGKHFVEGSQRLPQETKQFTEESKYKSSGKFNNDMDQLKK